MFNILNLFRKSRTKLYYIELDDEQINKEMSTIIFHMETEISQFKRNIDETTMEVKDEELLNLYKEMTKIKNDIDKIEQDINKIVGMKLDNLKYFIIKDDSYLYDKKQDIETIQQLIISFLQIIEQRPSHEALKRNLIEELLRQLTDIQELIKKMIMDDVNLQTIYRKIANI